MRPRSWLDRACLGGFLAMALAKGAIAAGDAVPVDPRCEYRVNPIGIDVERPRLSWRIDAPSRDWRQSAYRILASSGPDALVRDQGDLWDSGPIKGDDSTAIVYAGKPLKTHQACYWKVRVWDQAGKESAWSKPASWSLGLRSTSEWGSSAWIGHDASRQAGLVDAPLEGARWIWHAPDKGPSKPIGYRLFVTTFRPPGNAKIKKAELIVAADDFCRFTINGQLVVVTEPGTGGWDRPVLAHVEVQLIPGFDNTVRVEVNNTAAGPAGLIAKLSVMTEDGRQAVLVTDASWKSVNHPGSNWHNRPLDTRNWPAASIEGDYGAAPWGRLKLATLTLPPPVYSRTEFTLAKPIRRATLHATALGIFDVHLNGRRVSDDDFNPGWTDYTKRVYYRAYDVTSMVHPGANALGAIVADGWYSGYVGFGRKRDHYGTHPRFRALLHLEHDDGSTTDLVTGPDWRATPGAILDADFLMGESYDARIVQSPRIKGWDRPGFNDASWAKVDCGAELSPRIQWHPAPPVRVIAEFTPRSIREPRPGVYVLDMGQNLAGVVRLKVKGAAGQAITLRHAERLNPDGTIYTTNLREARATDVYTLAGTGEETWSPRFTYHGFQYVEISGLKTPPTLDTITGLALSSDTPRVGGFACSDPMLNQLYSNIYWTQRANFIDIPTDCPQRDERLGWTGDAQVYIGTAALNCDVQAFFSKWLRDLTDGQRSDGQFPMVVPVKVAGDDGGPAWADAGVICPWTMYQVYGDRRLLERQYPSMARFVEFCKARSTPEWLPPAQYHCFGDWLSINAETPKDVIYTAYFANSARITAEAARLLGKSEQADHFEGYFKAIKAAFNHAFVAPDGRIKGGTQAAYVLPIVFDLLDGEAFRKAGEHLVEDIEKRGHLSTGFIGTKSLMQALTKIGRQDVAIRLLHNDSFPSWGFSIKQGATSIWERWDGWTPEKGFQDPGMNSFAHYSFGAVYQWMVENLGGIRSEGPAYKKIVIAPHFDPGLTWARTSYDSIQGPIATSWTRNDGWITLDVTIPANTTAQVVLPASGPDTFLVDDRPPLEVTELKAVFGVNRSSMVLTGSGHYRFSFRVDRLAE